MQNYINQLLEMLQEAHTNRPTLRYLELPEEMECLRDRGTNGSWHIEMFDYV